MSSTDPKYILLEDWARGLFRELPATATLRKWAREGSIEPPPVKVGKFYYVTRDAVPPKTGGTLRAVVADAPTALYRHFDAAGRLLYVGVSVNTMLRVLGHSHKASWFDLVVTIKIERFPNRAAALAAERAAIIAEQPAHNVKGAAKP